jgi:hypothetical protein
MKRFNHPNKLIVTVMIMMVALLSGCTTYYRVKDTSTNRR